jgi:membrane glycosyltransferase
MLTPAGIQEANELTKRRYFVLALNIFGYGVLLSLAWHVLGASGWGFVNGLLFFAFACGTPWAVVGFWNALIGLYFLHFTQNGLEKVAPFLKAALNETPLHTKTAILMTLRNEDPERAIKRLKAVKQSVDETGEGKNFAYFLLSDSNIETVYSQEEQLAAQWGEVIYRRRLVNEGFKAGNVRDFCAQWGKDFDLMLPLDADSVMDGETIISMVRICEAYPKLGILQSLVVGMPSTSAFARLFQFGMRAGMRTYTMGQAWWVGDCGPFWGHNALVRIRPFYEECHLPLLKGKPPLGGAILSHDQVEATLMRKAGYEVRVMPIESGSYEENPPTLPAFSARDVRWCQGNLQYLKILDLEGLKPMSRFQLVWAILMFIGVPAWTLIILLTPFKVWQGGAFPLGAGITLYFLYFLMYLMPKIAGFIDILLTPNETKRYGGTGNFLLSALSELTFSFLLGAATTFRITLFMIGLCFGKTVIWGGQQRDAKALSWGEASLHLWPQLVFGLVVLMPLYLLSPSAFYWSLPLTLGFVVAIPFAVLTASPLLGQFFVKSGLSGIPEDFNLPPILKSIMEKK